MKEYTIKIGEVFTQEKADELIEYLESLSMNKEKMEEVIREALGEASALFMSQEKKGTDIVMPTEELIRISEETVKRILTNQ